MVKNNRGIVIGYSRRHTENYQFLQEIKSTQRFVLFYLNYSTFNWVLLYSFSLFSLQKIEHFKQQVSGWHRVILILYKFLLLCVVQLVIILQKENRKQHYYHSQSYSDSHYHFGLKYSTFKKSRSNYLRKSVQYSSKQKDWNKMLQNSIHGTFVGFIFSIHKFNQFEFIVLALVWFCFLLLRLFFFF